MTKDLSQYIHPEDERLVRGADPVTAGLTLIAVASLRRLIEQMYPWMKESRGMSQPTSDIQCGSLVVHLSHEYSVEESGVRICPGVWERHCTMELAHKEHAFDENGVRMWCEGTVAPPEPEPSYEERYCHIPGGCDPGHLYADNSVTYVCPGGTG
jgi:hypothetical protein